MPETIVDVDQEIAALDHDIADAIVRDLATVALRRHWKRG